MPRHDASIPIEASMLEAARRVNYIAAMTTTNDIAEIGALIGDPGRANILSALLDGRALTAGELAYAARVAPPTASWHLSGLTKAGLLAVEKQGRHRYYRLASPAVAQMLEAVMNVAAGGPPRRRTAWKGGEALRTARTCYDHLAGRLGVALADALMAGGDIELNEDGGRVTEKGAATLAAFGIAAETPQKRRRPFCRPCLDWSERRPHLAGALGAALAGRAFELGWVERLRDTRALAITETGRSGFAERFGIALG